MRGNLQGLARRLGINRSIPASAGQPHQAGYWNCHISVYPRECGATGWYYGLLKPRQGLSPRVRGNLLGRWRRAGRRRSIPASAGQPRSRRSHRRRRPVYPRECGATFVVMVLDTFGKGLSPRVRGNRPSGAHTAERGRSIPASAGQPKPATCTSGLPWVYPRECGATGVVRAQVGALHGLSPRVRGNRGFASFGAIAARSIPASAGQPSAPC